MLWPEWLVLSQLVLCWAPCLESIQCTEEQGRTEWGRCLCPLHRDVGAILLKPSSKHPPELQENLGPWCVRSHVAGKILICGKENKMVWAEIGQSSQPHCPSVWSSHPPCTTPSSMFTLLLLCASPQGFTALVLTCAFSWRIHLCPADTTSLVPPLCWQGSSSSACYPWVSISEQFVRSPVSFYKRWGADPYLA